MEVLSRRSQCDAAESQLIAGGMQFFDGSRFGGIDAREANEPFRVLADVPGHVVVGNLGFEVTALEAKDNGLVRRFSSKQVVGNICRRREGGVVVTAWLTQAGLTDLSRTLPYMCMTIDDQGSCPRLLSNTRRLAAIDPSIKHGLGGKLEQFLHGHSCHLIGCGSLRKMKCRLLRQNHVTRQS